MYLLRLALRPWRMAPLSQAFSALAVGCLLFLGGLFAWMQSALGPVLYKIESRQVLTAYLDPLVEKREEARIVDSIRLSAGAKEADPRELSVKLVTPEGFVERLKSHYPDLSRELLDLGSEMGAIVPRFVSVSGTLPEGALERIRKIQGIESAESSRDRNRHVVAAFTALRWVARLMSAGIALALLTGLIHLARMNAQFHRETLAVLKLWGASGLELRLPAILSGVWVGLLGGILAASAWALSGALLADHLRTLSPALDSLPALPRALAAAGLLLGGLAVGAVAGIAGAAEARG